LASLSIASILFISCVGLDADIEIRANGSGTIKLGYRISRLVESMGKLDGNERWLPLPVGRADLERTVARVNGLSLSSFSSKQDENDVSIQTELEFTNLQALGAFLDASGRTSSINQANGKSSLTIRFAEGGGALDPELKRLVDEVFKGYLVAIRVRTPSDPASSSAGTATAPSIGTATINAAARTASYSASIAELLSSTLPVVWTITW
jgi:hypothetical protein